MLDLQVRLHIQRVLGYDVIVARSKPSKAWRTTLFLDPDLMREAQAILRTKSHSDTVRAALYELVALRRRLALLDMELPDLTQQAVERMREDRVFVEP